jgi:amino acid transporter
MSLIEQFKRKKSMTEFAEVSSGDLKRELRVIDLTALGIAAVVGAGVFSTIGNAAFNGGPGVIFLFIFTAIACSFSALCYAEFASCIPASGSAYTYAYVSMGELFAWIIGWALIMEYAVGNIAVAISWSDYFTTLLDGHGLYLPRYLTMDYLSASRAFEAVSVKLAEGISFESLSASGITPIQLEGFAAWTNAPQLGSLKLIGDIPALLVTFLTTVIVYIGIKESKRISNLMVLLKMGVLLLVIAVGAYFVQPVNWIPFTPNGMSGILKGVSSVFFAYIGFDAISTTAEECVNPQRDLPRAMFYSLGICTVLYILVSLVLTGMTHYTNLAVGDPLAFVFGAHGANVPWISNVVAISATVALFSVLLVFQLGQPRIWLSMSRDGLLPKAFARIHPKYRTPSFATVITGLLVGIPCLFFNLTEVTDLTSIGTLWAFVLVSYGALKLDPKRPKKDGEFRITYINSKYLFPMLVVLIFAGSLFFNPDGVKAFFSLSSETETLWSVFKHKIPLIVYMIALVVLSIKAFLQELSLIPLLGVATSGYLMTELGYYNWQNFTIWLVFGLCIYLYYGLRRSKLAVK